MRMERLAVIGCLALGVATQARGQEREVAVGMLNPQAVPCALLAQAQRTAARIYAGVGVKLRWRSRPGTEIWMQFDTSVPPEVYPGAMGYARPYGKTETSIHILLDRALGAPNFAGVLLGHVMAHELGHVLEGINRHSDSGLMKARWDQHDLQQMLVTPLSFSSEDTGLVQMGVKRLVAGESLQRQEKLKVVMFDYAGAPTPVLASAAEEARAAFEAAGVETDWAVCQVSADPSRHCVLPRPDTFLRVMILPAPAKGLLSHNGLAYARKCPPTEGCIIAYVSYRQVLTYAQNDGRPVTIALAWVMAHEIGHLMGMGHSSSGIMKAHFDRRDLPDTEIGRLRFSGEDAKKLPTVIALWIASVAGTGDYRGR